MTAPLAVRWSRQLPCPLRAEPVLAGGALVVCGVDASVRALDPATGAERWSVALEGTAAAPAAGPAGLHVAVHVTGAARPGYLTALAPATGERLWTFKAAGALQAPPLEADGLLVAVANAKGQGHVFAIDPGAPRRPRWSAALPRPVGARPSHDRDLVLVSCLDGALHALDRATGATRWTAATGKFLAAPAAVRGGRVCVGSADQALHCFERETGAPRWRFPTGGTVSGEPDFDGEAVVFGSWDGFVYAVDGSGALRWRFAAASEVVAGPLVDTLVYVGTQDGTLHALDRASGRPVAFNRPGHGGNPAIPARPIGDADAIYVVRAGGEVLALGRAG